MKFGIVEISFDDCTEEELLTFIKEATESLIKRGTTRKQDKPKVAKTSGKGSGSYSLSEEDEKYLTEHYQAKDKVKDIAEHIGKSPKCLYYHIKRLGLHRGFKKNPLAGGQNGQPANDF